MSRLFGFAGVQMSVVPWDAQATMDKMTEAVMSIRRTFPWVQLIMFPELAAPGVAQFVASPSPEVWQKAADTIPGQYSDRLCELARKAKVWLVPGTLYEKEDDRRYNTAVAISPDGDLVAKYRKIFPWYPYEANTTPGEAFCVFDIPSLGRFGLLICYDMWFPETCRTLAWMGAEVLLQPTLTTTSDRELELVMCRANAIFNQAYFLSVNGVGPYGGGRSLLIDPDGRVLQEAGTGQAIMTEIIDLDNVTRTREYGTIGMAQTLKQLRDSGQAFPVYGNARVQGFESLGPLKLHKDTPG